MKAANFLNLLLATAVVLLCAKLHFVSPRAPSPAPAPAAARGKLCCGMSLLVEADMIEQARDVMRRKEAAYHSVVPLENQLQPRRDRYC